MFKGKDDIWRTAGGIPVSAAQAAELDKVPVKGVELRDDKMVNIHGNVRKIDYAQVSDFQVAGEVRMLMRGDLNHEGVCCMARDRIMYLSELVAEAREMLAQVGSGWPPSRPMHDAPRDGTYVLLSGTEGKAVCRWVGDTKFGGLGRWQLRGSGATFNNPGRFWDLPQD